MNKKITKKYGIEVLKNNISKMVLSTGNCNIDGAIGIIERTEDANWNNALKSPNRIAVKGSNTQIEFEILEGENKGEHSYASSLSGSNFYEYNNKLGKFIIIESFSSDKTFSNILTYFIVK